MSALDFAAVLKSDSPFTVSYRIAIGRQVMQGLHTVTGNATNTLNRRPFFVFWFMAQIKSYV